MNFKKVKLIISPVSRPGWVDRYIPGVLAILREGGLEVEETITQAAGDPGRLAAEAQGAYDAVLVAGGDGSLNEVLNVLAGSDMPVGIIPFGTVNVFAREMGIPLNPVEGARAFLAGQAEYFDMGCMGDRRFLLMVSYGFDVVALRRNPRLLKRLVGKYAYVLTGLVFFPFYDNRPIRVFLDDDESPIDAYFALFANSRLYAGSHVVARSADMQDGLLDVVLITKPGKATLLKGSLAVMMGNLVDKPWVVSRQVKKIRFEAPNRDLFQVDGDAIGPDANEITIDPKAIRIVVHRDSSPG